jgi:hypothetical protein
MNVMSDFAILFRSQGKTAKHVRGIGFHHDAS